MFVGLTGDSQSEYIKSFVNIGRRNLGARCVVFNFRGRGGHVLKTPRTYVSPNNTQCSKIGKKCNFKSTKTHFLQFQKWQKINFCTRKKFKTTKNAILNFFLVQKLIFCHF